MRRGDLADSPLASYTPDIPSEVDSIRDILREVFASFYGDMPSTVEEFQTICFELIDRALSQINVVEFDRSAVARGEAEVIAQVLKLISKDTDRHYRMRALCYLRLLGKEGRSFEELGKELGTTRAAVNNCYRSLQKRMGDIPGRGDKRPEAREKYRRIRMGQRRVRGLWPGQTVWLRSLSDTPHEDTRPHTSPI